MADKWDVNLFAWKPEYSVGHAEIDQQHEKLFHIADELHRAMMERRGKESLGAILKRLITYTEYHFGTEERLMQEAAYPGYLQHRIEHAKLTGQVLEHQRKMDRGEIVVSIEVLQFVSDWLKHHIGGSDQKLSANLKARARLHSVA